MQIAVRKYDQMHYEKAYLVFANNLLAGAVVVPTKSKSWYVFVWTPDVPDGKRITEVQFATRKEAVSALLKVQGIDDER